MRPVRRFALAPEALERRVLLSGITGAADGPDVRAGAGGPHRTIGTVDFNTNGILDARLNVGTADEDRARTAATTDGGFVMVWTQSTGTSNILAQRFASNGDPIAPVITVAAAAAPAESQPDVTALPGGGFAVVWVQGTGASNDLGVAVYGSSGTAPTATATLSNAGTVAEIEPTISFLGGAGNHILVTWAVAGGTDKDIFGQRLLANGNLVDATPVLLTGTADNFNSFTNPAPHAAAGLGDGSFALTWVQTANVKVQRFDAALAGGAIATLDQGALTDREPDVAALTGGGYVVVWEADRPLDPSLLWGQRFTAAGIPDGTSVELTGDIPATETEPSVSGLADGGYAVAWNGNDGPNNTGDVRLRLFNANGTPRGAAVNVTFTGFTPNPGAQPIRENDQIVTAMPDGRVLLSWVDPDPRAVPRASEDDILYQIFDPGTGQPLTVSNVATSFPLPTTFARFDANETLDLILVQGLSDFGHSLAVGFQDTNFDFDPGPFIEPAWVIQRGHSAAETALLDALIADPANNHVIVNLSIANPGAFTFGINGTTSEAGGTPGTRSSLTRNVDVVFGAPPADVTPPTVTNVFVAGTAWNAAYRNTLVTSGTGEAAFGHRIVATEQTRTMAWSNLNQVSVRFSENVVVAQNDLTVTGVNVASYATNAFTYDATTFTATWTLSTVIANDKITLNLDADAGTGVADPAGNFLDGEWTNPVHPSFSGDTFPSGNGTAGGDFLFNLRVLPGDINRDGAVNVFDFNVLRPNLNQSGAGVLGGDINGDDIVNMVDFNEYRPFLGRTTPT